MKTDSISREAAEYMRMQAAIDEEVKPAFFLKTERFDDLAALLESVRVYE